MTNGISMRNGEAANGAPLTTCKLLCIELHSARIMLLPGHELAIAKLALEFLHFMAVTVE